eukprot:5924950-Amphidinium_carterae.3
MAVASFLKHARGTAVALISLPRHESRAMWQLGNSSALVEGPHWSIIPGWQKIAFDSIQTTMPSKNGGMGNQ